MSMSDDIREVWSGQLDPVPPELISPGVSPTTRRFLETVGLPTAEAQGITFVHDDRLSRPVIHLGRDYLWLAEDLDGFRFGVDLATDRVDLVFNERVPKARFANSDPALFVLTLGLFERDVQRFLEPDPSLDRRIDAVLAFQAVLAERDSAAAKDGTYWPGMLDGILEE